MTPRRMAVAERNLLDTSSITNPINGTIPMVGTHNTTLTAVRATIRIPIIKPTCPMIVVQAHALPM